MQARTGDTDLNSSHRPSQYAEQVLETMKDGRERGEPWGYTTPATVAAEHGTRNVRINEALDELENAGWVEQVEVEGEAIRGFYRLVADPRERGDEDGE